MHILKMGINSGILTEDINLLKSGGKLTQHFSDYSFIYKFFALLLRFTQQFWVLKVMFSTKPSGLGLRWNDQYLGALKTWLFSWKVGFSTLAANWDVLVQRYLRTLEFWFKNEDWISFNVHEQLISLEGNGTFLNHCTSSLVKTLLFREGTLTFRHFFADVQGIGLKFTHTRF